MSGDQPDAPVSKIPPPSDATLSRILAMLRPWSRPDGEDRA